LALPRILAGVSQPPTQMPRAPQPTAEVLDEPMRSRWSPSVFDADHTLSREEV